MELDELNLRNPISIGYYDPFSVYPSIKADLESKLPLTGLHWKYHPTKPLKSIPLLPVKLVEEVPKAIPRNSNNSSTASTRPSHSNATATPLSLPASIASYQTQNVYTRLMFVKYESIDTYRSQVRPLIKEWLKNLVLTSNSEWMIVLFIPSTSKDKQSTIIKTSAFDKLKIDFGVDGKELKTLGFDDWWSDELDDFERCFKLKESSGIGLNKMETFNELINSLKTLLLASFTNKFQDLSGQLTTTSVPDLGKFMTKLRYADLFNDMRILQDSLNIYDELYKDLEKLFTVDKGKFSMAIPFASIISSKGITTPDSKEIWNDLKFESPDRVQAIKSTLLTDAKINLFGLRCLIFINQSVLLQSLANFANTISISAIYISTLYQKLIYFLNDLSNTFVNEDLSEFTISIIDNYLELPISHKLITINNQNNENSDTPYQLNEIMEFQGELNLFKRSKLIKIANGLGYTLNGFSEILDETLDTLAEVSLEENTVEENSNGHSESKKTVPHKLSYSPLLEALKSEQTYFDHFEQLTEVIIQQFVTCNRSKTIDILSIDLALLNYQKGKYQESLNILQNSYDFFILNGWNFMGGVLLEIYLDCIERLRSCEYDQVLMTCLKLFSTLINNNSKQNKFGINNYKLIKKREQIQNLYAKVKKYSKKLTEPLIYPVDHTFTINILPHIKADETSPLDKYYIEIDLSNLFGIEFKFERIDIKLWQVFQDENTDQDLIGGNQVTFSSEDVKVSDQLSHRIKLFTNEFVLGTFVPIKISVTMEENIKLIKNLETSENGFDIDSPDNTVIQYHTNGNGQVHNETANFSVPAMHGKHTRFGASLQNIGQLSFFPDSSKLHCYIKPSPSIQLGSSELVLIIQNGSKKIENVEVQLASSTKGLILKNETISIAEIGNSQSSTNLIFYTYFSDNKLINIRSRITYTCEGQQFSHIFNQDVEITLKISVSVQDIFKPDSIYSKFQIGTSNPSSPIRILSNELKTSNTNYEILQPKLPLKPALVTFGEQPASIFYKIKPAESYKIRSTDSLDLKLEYSSLKDECSKYFDNFVQEELKKHELSKYWFVLKLLVLKFLKFDLNNYAINSFIRITNTNEIKYHLDEVTQRYIETKEEQTKLLNLFVSIIGDQKSEVLDASTLYEPHQLFITVPLSTLKYLQILEFEYEKKVKYLVGEPIEVKLKLDTITKWHIPSEPEGDESIIASSSPENSPSKPSKKPDTANIENGPTETSLVHFQLSLQNDDNWLISGFKKHTFSINPSKLENQTELDIILVPLNVGKMLLPKVTIKCLTTETGKDFSMDMDVKNGLETLLVVPDLDSITFSF